MGIRCRNKDGTGCNAEILATEDLMLWKQASTSGLQIIASPEIAEQAETYQRRDCVKNISRVPYKLHCRECGNSLGATIKKSTFLVDSFAWDKCTMVLRNTPLLPHRKWVQYSAELQKILAHVPPGRFSTARPTTQLPTAEPTVYCRMDSVTRASIDNLTATKPREYQKELIELSLERSTLVCLPTGSGKTLVAASVIHAMKAMNPRKVAVFVVNTVPLVYQQGAVLRRQLPARLIVAELTGDSDQTFLIDTVQMLRERRLDVLVITCGKLINLISGDLPKFSLSHVCVIVLDEAHNARGKSPYANLVEDYKCVAPSQRPLLLALTASPLHTQQLKSHGQLLESIDSLNRFLNTTIGYPTTHIESLKRHALVPNATCRTEPLSYSDLQLHTAVLHYCRSVLQVFVQLVPQFGSLDDSFAKNPWGLRGFLRGQRKTLSLKEGNPKAAAVLSLFMDLMSALELLEVIGSEASLDPFQKLLDSIDQPSSPMEKMKQSLLGSAPGRSRLQLVLSELNTLPNLSSRWKVLVHILSSFVRDNDGSKRCIVFVRMRRTARKLCELLRGEDELVRELNPMVFVGHTGQGGMGGWRQQQTVLKWFKRGFTKVLVGTSVLEEGLDVPSCNLVVRFNCEISLQSLIQSSGRASRAQDGSYVTICPNFEDAKKLENIYEQEKIMIRVIQQLTLRPTMASKPPQVCELKPLEITTVEDDFADVPDEAAVDSESDEDEGGHGIRQVALYEDLFAANPDDDAWEFGMGLDGSIMNIPEACDLEDLKAWLETFSKVFGFKEVAVPRDYRGLRRVDFELHSAQERIDLGWEVIERWKAGYAPQMWLSVGIGRRRKAGCRVSVESLRCGNWKGPNTMSHVFSVSDKSCLRIEYSEQRAFFEFPIVEPPTEEDFNSLWALVCGTQTKHLELRFNLWQVRDFVIIDNSVTSTASVFLTLVNPPKLVESIATFIVGGYEFEQRIRLVDSMSPRVPGDQIGLCKVFEMRIASEDLPHMLNVLAGIRKTPWFTKVNVVQPAQQRMAENEGGHNLSMPDNLFEFDTDDEGVSYGLKCVQSAFGYWPGRFDHPLPPRLSRYAQRSGPSWLYALTEQLENDLFSSTESLLNVAASSRWVESDWDIRENTCWVKRITVTPTRILFNCPDLLQMNRILRKHPPEQFVRVCFRDEDLSKISSATGDNVKQLIHRVKTVLQNGINIGCHHYQFLTSTSSQIRDHNCWFVCSNTETGADRAQSIRDEMGDFSEIQVVATYISRLGQSFSTSTATVDVDVGIWGSSSDVRHGDYCFSDGIGTISASLASQVADSMDLVDTPSAFQIRFGGAKGVVSIDPSMTGDMKLCVRASMQKFQSMHSNLEVLNVARPLPMYLNQQIIMQLSNLGIGDEVFMQLLMIHLNSLLEMLRSNEKAFDMLKRMQTGLPWRSVEEAGVQIVHEPFFRSLLLAYYRSQIRSIIEKARIPIPDDDGRVLLGVMDETGGLEYGEVFVHISVDMWNTLGESRVIEGPVAVAKSPCLHPGDTRVLKAVNRVNLLHHKDVIVFPQKGPRPHPDEMSGSDLDGDLYHAIWDPNLVPTQPMHEPMNYEAPEKLKVDGEITVQHMINFMCEYMEKDNLGMIDNLHKALADHKGMESEECILLAELHSLAVDAPKTGKWAKIPRDILNEIGDQGYPDFMMKARSYDSQKVLGTIFRHSKMSSTAANLAVVTGNGTDDDLFDKCFVYDGYEEYLADARQFRKAYNSQLLGIMHSSKVKTEGEVMSGVVDRSGVPYGQDMTEVGKIVQDLRENLVRSFQKKFMDNLEGVADSEARLKQASAWYFVTYNKNESPETFKVEDATLRFLSFPWIAAEILSEVKTKNAEKGIHSRTRSFMESMSKAIVKHFLDEQHILAKDLRRRETALGELQQYQRQVGDIIMYGSSAVLLFNKTSDLDVVLIPPNGGNRLRKDQVKLLKRAKDPLGRVAKRMRLVTNARVPNLELTYRIVRDSSKIKVDITADSEGLRKAECLRMYFVKYTWLLPVARMVLKWGRNTGLMGHKRYAPIPSNALAFVVVNVAIRWELIEPISEEPADVEEDWEALCDNLSSATEEDFSGGPAGECLDAFFSSSRMQEKFEIHPVLQTVLGQSHFHMIGHSDGWSLLEEQMQIAGHVLLLSNDVNTLLQKFETERVFFLGKKEAHGIIGAEKQYTRWLQYRSGANVSMEKTTKTSPPGLFIKASGVSGQIHHVGRAFEQLVAQGTSLRYTAQKIPFTPRVFIEGSSQLLAEGLENNSQKVALEDYYGNRQPFHDNRPTYTVRVKTCGDARSCNSVAKFQEHFEDRLDLMARDYSTSFHGEITFSASLGHIYIVDPPDSYVEDPEGVSVDQLTAALQNSRKRNLPSHLSVHALEEHSTGSQSRSKWFPKNPSMRGSFYTGIRDASTDEVEVLLSEMGYGDPVTEDVFKVILHLPSYDLKIVYDQDLELINYLAEYRVWSHTDFKRRFIDSGEDLRGNEVDVRFQIRTRQNRPVEGCLGEELKNLLSWRRGSERGNRNVSDLVIKDSFRSKVSMIRHCNQQIYKYVGREGRRPGFMENFRVHVGVTKVLCRPDPEHEGRFITTEQIVDVRLKLEVKQVPDRVFWGSFAHRLWGISMKLSDLFSGAD